jgi:hypothetical protein
MSSNSGLHHAGARAATVATHARTAAPARGAALAVALILAGAATATADPAPRLRGPLHDTDIGAAAAHATALTVSTGAGYTTNAGPTLAKRPSAVLETGLALAHVSRTEARAFDATLDVALRRFPDARDIELLDYRLAATHAARWAPAWTLTHALRAGRSTDVDEDVAETGWTVTSEWALGPVTPFAKVSAVYLDYADLPSIVLEFENQDDRDRLAGSSEIGARYAVTDSLWVSAGGGADAKRYRAAHDDFGLRRDNRSLYPFAAAGYRTASFEAELFLARVRRTFREPSFAPLAATVGSVRAGLALRPGLRLHAGAGISLEETDFLDARTQKEHALTGGLSWQITQAATAIAEATVTSKEFVGFERIDHKLELTVLGKTRIADKTYLTARADYTDFKSTFGGAATDMVQMTLGLAYELGR